ncbi:MAG TPA: hypothetical protein VF942_02040 [Acidimicrobiales bacterium]
MPAPAQSGMTLKSRPACHRKREYTDAHLSIVFAALAVTSFIEDRTGRSIEALRPHRPPLRHYQIRARPVRRRAARATDGGTT